MQSIRYSHTNLNARDWRKLSAFYQEVFGCRSLGLFRDNRGEWFERLTGLRGARAVGEHIALPGYPKGEGPTMEIFSYDFPDKTGPLPVNGLGFCHICFEIDDVEETVSRFLAAGGRIPGEGIARYYPERKGTNILIYGQDPEGNTVEMKKWCPGTDLTGGKGVIYSKYE